MLFHGREWNFSVCFLFLHQHWAASRNPIKEKESDGYNKQRKPEPWRPLNSSQNPSLNPALRKWWACARLQWMSCVSELLTLLKSSPGRNYFSPTTFLLEREAEEHLPPLLYCSGCLQNCSSHMLSLLSADGLLMCWAGFFPFFVTESLPTTLMGSALARVESNWCWLYQT